MTKSLSWLFLGLPLLAAQPPVKNALIQTRAVSGSLESTFQAILSQQSGPAWIAYSISHDASERSSGWNECGTVRLEGVTESSIFYRIEGRQIETIRTFPADCEIDGGGLPVYWLTGVDQAQSIGVLQSLIPAGDGRTERRLANQALYAIVLHRDGVTALIEIAQREHSGNLRKRAVYWLSRSHDPRATKFFEDVLAKR